jgi:uncharacterized protein (TIGR02646 family)
MIRLPDIALPADAEQGLQAYQAKVDAVHDYAARVAAGKVSFGSANRRGNAVFDAVKSTLDRMCSGVRRCAFCEDSMADEVEHFRPKDLYPQHVFRWPNYLYACGPCNVHKNNRFAVFPSSLGEIREVSRKQNDPVLEPSAGDSVLLDPRIEDATGWMMLDLRDTFRFVPLATKGTRSHARAEYTIKALGLNRDVLLRARKEAYFIYESLLRRYMQERRENLLAERLETIERLKRSPHPSVWRAMQRQHDKIPALQKLFAAVPEATSW